MGVHFTEQTKEWARSKFPDFGDKASLQLQFTVRLATVSD